MSVRETAPVITEPSGTAVISGRVATCGPGMTPVGPAVMNVRRPGTVVRDAMCVLVATSADRVETTVRLPGTEARDEM